MNFRSLNSSRFARAALLVALVVGLFFTVALDAVAGASAALVVYGAANAIALAARPVDRTFGVTLTSTEILMDVIDAFSKSFPPLNRLGTDFKRDPIKKDKTITAHIASIPSVASYDNTTGYKNGAQEARSLLIDVDVKADQHKHVPLLWKHIYNIADQKNEYKKIIGYAGYALAKQVVDYALATATSRNFSQSSTYAEADCDADMLSNVQGDMNALTTMGGRTLLVNTGAAGALSLDGRITSRDYAGQYPGASPLRGFRGIHGFEEIMEYPDLPTNNGSTLTGVTGVDSSDTFTKASHGFQDGDRIKFSSLTGGSNLSTSTIYFVRDAATNTFKIAATSGGSAVNLGSDVSDASVALAENLAAFAFDRRALAVVAGPPQDFGAELATMLGIPQVMGYELVTHPESGITMAAVSWQEAGTGNLYWSPTLVYGVAAGKMLISAGHGAGIAAGTRLDYAGHRVVTA